MGRQDVEGWTTEISLCGLLSTLTYVGDEQEERGNVVDTSITLNVSHHAQNEVNSEWNKTFVGVDDMSAILQGSGHSSKSSQDNVTIGKGDEGNKYARKPSLSPTIWHIMASGA